MLLRLVLNTGVFVFYISCFSVFLTGFNCNWFMEGQGEIVNADGNTEVVDLRFRLNRFTEISEWSLRVVQRLCGYVHGLHACAVFVYIFVRTCVYVCVCVCGCCNAQEGSGRFIVSPHALCVHSRVNAHYNAAF